MSQDGVGNSAGEWDYQIILGGLQYLGESLASQSIVASGSHVVKIYGNNEHVMTFVYLAHS